MFVLGLKCGCFQVLNCVVQDCDFPGLAFSFSLIITVVYLKLLILLLVKLVSKIGGTASRTKQVLSEATDNTDVISKTSLNCLLIFFAYRLRYAESPYTSPYLCRPAMMSSLSLTEEWTMYTLRLTDGKLMRMSMMVNPIYAINWFLNSSIRHITKSALSSFRVGTMLQWLLRGEIAAPRDFTEHEFVLEIRTRDPYYNSVPH